METAQTSDDIRQKRDLTRERVREWRRQNTLRGLRQDGAPFRRRRVLAAGPRSRPPRVLYEVGSIVDRYLRGDPSLAGPSLRVAAFRARRRGLVGP